MAELLWRKAGNKWQIPARTALRDGLEVHMEGRRFDVAMPGRFDLLRLYSPSIAAAARALGRAPWKHLEGDTWDAKPIGAHSVRTDALPLKATRFTGTHRWRFADPSTGLSSPVVRTARFIDVRIRGLVGPPATLPVEAKIGVEATVPTSLGDPTVALALLLPWGTAASRGVTLRDVVREELTSDPGELEGELYETVMSDIGRYMPKQPPDGWISEPSPRVLEVKPGRPRRAKVSIALPVETGVALAVAATDLENEKRRGVSDVVVLERGVDGSYALLYVGS